LKLSLFKNSLSFYEFWKKNITGRLNFKYSFIVFTSYMKNLELSFTTLTSEF
jgi:hypothetical protein